MSKALTPLKALKDIGSLNENGIRISTLEEYKIVEEALKDAEKQKKLLQILHIAKESKYTNQEKALKIIMQFKNLNLLHIQGQWYLLQGIDFLHCPNVMLTKEEAFLMADVLKKYE